MFVPLLHLRKAEQDVFLAANNKTALQVSDDDPVLPRTDLLDAIFADRSEDLWWHREVHRGRLTGCKVHSAKVKELSLRIFGQCSRKKAKDDVIACHVSSVLHCDCVSQRVSATSESLGNKMAAVLVGICPGVVESRVGHALTKPPECVAGVIAVGAASIVTQTHVSKAT